VFIPGTITKDIIANTKEMEVISQKPGLAIALENCHWQGLGTRGKNA
jgi:hypothetical protein